MKRKHSGFTLMEMTIVIFVLAFLAAIATPDILAWQENARLSGAVQELYSNLQRARLEAVKRGVNCAVTFGEDVDGTNYDYAVYMDTDGNYRYTAGETVIGTHSWSDTNTVSLVSNTIDAAPGKASIAFSSEGLPKVSGGGPGSGTVTLKNSRNRQSRVLILAAGSIQIG